MSDPIEIKIKGAPEAARIPEADVSNAPRLSDFRNTGNKESLLDEIADRLIRERKLGRESSPVQKAVEEVLLEAGPVESQTVTNENIAILVRRSQLQSMQDLEDVVRLLKEQANDPIKTRENIRSILRDYSPLEAAEILKQLRREGGEALFQQILSELNPFERELATLLSQGETARAIEYVMKEILRHEVNVSSSEVSFISNLSSTLKYEVKALLRADGELSSKLKVIGQQILDRSEPDKESYELFRYSELVSRVTREPEAHIEELKTLLRRLGPDEIRKLEIVVSKEQGKSIYEAVSPKLPSEEKLDVGLALHGKPKTHRDPIIDREASLEYEQWRLGLLRRKVVSAFSQELKDAREKIDRALDALDAMPEPVLYDLEHRDGDAISRLGREASEALHRFRKRRPSYIQTADLWLCFALGVVVFYLLRMVDVAADESVLGGLAAAGLGKALLSSLSMNEPDPKPIFERARRRKAEPRGTRAASRSRQIRDRRKRAKFGHS